MTGNASPLDGMGRVCIASPSLWGCATANLWLTSVAPMPAANRKKPRRDKCSVSRDFGAEVFTIRLLRFEGMTEPRFGFGVGGVIGSFGTDVKCRPGEYVPPFSNGCDGRLAGSTFSFILPVTVEDRGAVREIAWKAVNESDPLSARRACSKCGPFMLSIANDS